MEQDKKQRPANADASPQAEEEIDRMDYLSFQINASRAFRNLPRGLFFGRREEAGEKDKSQD